MRGDKELRLRVSSCSMQTEKILFHRTGTKDLITQMVEFNNMKDKDLADAFSLMANKVIEDDKRIVIPEIFTVSSTKPLFRKRGLSD